MSPATSSLDEAAPDLCASLRECSSAMQARQRFGAWLDARRQAWRDAGPSSSLLADVRARQCIQVLDDITAPRNEARVAESSLEWLWRLLREDPEAVDTVRPGFVAEWVALLAGARHGESAPAGWMAAQLPTRDMSLRGRRAGVERSAVLDAMGEQLERGVGRFDSGLDEASARRQMDNRRRILAALRGTDEDWFDHRWQMRNIFAGTGALHDLQDIATLSPTETSSIRRALEYGVPFGITPHYLSLMDLDDCSGAQDAQVRSQVIPPPHYVERMIEHREERASYFDFMGESDTSPVSLVTRRYPSVAILKALDTCPQICVYCQRNFEIEGPMQARGFPPSSTLDAALDWFADHDSVFDILVTGGDPIFHETERIVSIMERIAAMEHVTHVRWGTRAPVTMPMRLTESLADALGRFVEPGRRTVSLVTHVESAQEVTQDMAEVVHRFRKRAISVYNQQVYTVFTSRRFQTVALRIALRRVGIDPYYCFYPKGKAETRDYIVPLARLLQERAEEARLLPGVFRTEEPVFNVPRLGKNQIRASQDRELIGIRTTGARVYLWHPWEKGIAAAEPWQYEDVPIHDYLERMAALGENVEDYASIWSYY